MEEAQREGFHPDVDVSRLASVMWTTMHGLADLWIRGGGLPGADATFGLDEFIALSQSIALGVDAGRRPPAEYRKDDIMTTPSHHYLEGNFGPVHEEVTAVDLPVTGTIPAELDGRLLRNGPNPIGTRTRRPTTGSPATAWSTACGSGTGRPSGTATGGCAAPRWRPRSASPHPPSPYADDVQLFAANTNVVSIAGKTFAIVEAGAPPVELTDELETVGPSNFSGTLEHPFSAHPKRRPASPVRCTSSRTTGRGATRSGT